GRGAPMTYLSHNASFHSRENITPSNPGTKHLGIITLNNDLLHITQGKLPFSSTEGRDIKKYRDKR
ncbi:hypothetical protein, partial [Gluconobacter oxydans]